MRCPEIVRFPLAFGHMATHPLQDLGVAAANAKKFAPLPAKVQPALEASARKVLAKAFATLTEGQMLSILLKTEYPLATRKEKLKNYFEKLRQEQEWLGESVRCSFNQ